MEGKQLLESLVLRELYSGPEYETSTGCPEAIVRYHGQVCHLHVCGGQQMTELFL